MPNPFFFGPKITNPKYFVGRETELKDIFGFLNTEYTAQIQHVSVVGERRIGKSSLLYHLTQVTEKYLGTDESYRFVYLDLQDPRCHTVKGFFGYILDELDLFRARTLTLETFYEAIEREREEKGIWVVLLMDEFEKLTERTAEFSDDFYDTLRSLGNNNLLGILTASQHSLRDLAEQKKLTSPFFNIFHQIELGAFSDIETQALLNRGRVSDQKFSDEDCQKIIKIAGHHPARLQIVADLVYKAKSADTLNWREIARSAKKEPAFESKRSPENALKNKIIALFDWIFVSFPQIIGKAFLQFIGREEIAETTAWLWGAFLLLVAIAFLFGALSWSTITKYTRELFGLID